MGAGGTITREAALQGTPVIIVEIFPSQHVNDFFVEKGFPIFEAKSSGLLRLAEELLGEKRTVKHLLAAFENPVDVIADVIRKIGES